MASSTDPHGYPFPEDVDPIDVAGDLQRLAEDLDDKTVIRKWATAAERAAGWVNPDGFSLSMREDNGGRLEFLDPYDDDWKRGPASSLGWAGVSPFIGAWPPGEGGNPGHSWRGVNMQFGRLSLTTTGFGDFRIPFVQTVAGGATGFEFGVLACGVTAGDPLAGSGTPGKWWWPVITSVSLVDMSCYAASVQGYPYATGHPPSLPAVWTIGGSNVKCSWWAIGV